MLNITNIQTAAKRVFLLTGLIIFFRIENNPVVVLAAKLHLSPPPLERFLKTKSFFSGMTEGVHKLALFDLSGALEANVFSPLVMFFLAFFVLKGGAPRLDTRQKETWFFAGFIGLSVVVNLVHGSESGGL